MDITIKSENNRFGVRVCAVIYNSDMTKVFLQEQKKDFYMFPGGRLQINEDTDTAIKRELEEELGLKEDLKLKYIIESFNKLPNTNYHEVGFYYITKVDEYKLKTECKSNDKDENESTFKWIDIDKLSKLNIVPNIMKEKLMLYDATSVEHVIYKEYYEEN